MKPVDDPSLRDLLERVIGSEEDIAPFFVKHMEYLLPYPFSCAIQSIEHEPDVIILLMSDKEKAGRTVKFMNSHLDIFSPHDHPMALALKILQVILPREI